MPRRRKAPDPPPRRKRNSGSVAVQRDGTFWAIPPAWADPGRKPRRGFLTWQEAASWLDVECARARHQDALPSGLTVRTYLAIWFPRVADSGAWAPSTRDVNRRRLKAYVALADVGLSELRPSQLQDVVAQMARRGVSAAVIAQTVGLIRRALADALDDGLVARNVAARLVLPKVRRSPPRAWTHAEVRRLLDVIEGDPLEPLVGLGLVLGLRIGEILGLHWDDVDITGTTLTVRRSFSGGLVGPTKTRRERTVRLPSRIWAALLRHHERQAPGIVWIFPSERKADRPLSYTRARTWLSRMVHRAEIRDLGSHALRHTAATAMLSNGVLPSNAAEQLGHANPGVTMSSYWSPTPGGEDPADVVSAWLDRPENGTDLGDTRHDARRGNEILEGE